MKRAKPQLIAMQGTTSIVPLSQAAGLAQFHFSRAQQPSSATPHEVERFVARRLQSSTAATISRHTSGDSLQQFSTRTCGRAQGDGLGDERSTFPTRDMISARNRELQPNAARGRRSWHAK
jgi:hypothetical protein